jgi:peptide/nickel transport system permease protein
MWRFVARRIGSSVVLLLVVSLIIFVLVRVLPGSPVLSKLGAVSSASKALVDNLRHQLGIDQPMLVQYWQWVAGAIHGDFGLSYANQYPVSSLISARLPATIELAIAAMIVAVLIAVPASTYGAIHPGSLFDRVGSALVTLGMAVPQFWLGILLVTLLSVDLGWLPARGYVSFATDPGANLTLLLMPSMTLGISLAAPIMRFLRTSLAEVSSSPFVLTAQGKGLPWRSAVIRHALPNAMMPTLTILGLIAGQLLGGVVLIEYIFGWPGLGSLTVSAITSRDYGVLEGVVLLLSAGFIGINLLVDLAYGVLDPRIRVKGAS